MTESYRAPSKPEVRKPVRFSPLRPFGLGAAGVARVFWWTMMGAWKLACWFVGLGRSMIWRLFFSGDSVFGLSDEGGCWSFGEFRQIRDRNRGTFFRLLLFMAFGLIFIVIGTGQAVSERKPGWPIVMIVMAAMVLSGPIYYGTRAWVRGAFHLDDRESREFWEQWFKGRS